MDLRKLVRALLLYDAIEARQRAAKAMPRLRRLFEQDGPEPLRRRGILAPPALLTMD